MLADQGTEGPQLGCTYIQLDATKTSRLESLARIDTSGDFKLGFSLLSPVETSP